MPKKSGQNAPNRRVSALGVCWNGIFFIHRDSSGYYFRLWMRGPPVWDESTKIKRIKARKEKGGGEKKSQGHASGNKRWIDKSRRFGGRGEEIFGTLSSRRYPPVIRFQRYSISFRSGGHFSPRIVEGNETAKEKRHRKIFSYTFHFYYSIPLKILFFASSYFQGNCTCIRTWFASFNLGMDLDHFLLWTTSIHLCTHVLLLSFST